VARISDSSHLLFFVLCVLTFLAVDFSLVAFAEDGTEIIEVAGEQCTTYPGPDIFSDTVQKSLTDETIDDTKEILLGGLLNENRVDFYQQYAENDETESTEEAHHDTTSDTYTLYIKGELYTRLWDAYDKLEYTERMMLAQRLGFCFDCHSTFYLDYDDLDEYGEPKKKPIKPMMYTDIATDHEYSSANTAHKKCEKALTKLKKAIKDLI